jgi:aminopeptidase
MSSRSPDEVGRPTIPGAIATPDEVSRYAETILTNALALGAGDLLLVDTEVVNRELTVALAEAAYARGADVDVALSDPWLGHAAFAGAPEDSLGEQTAWRKRRMSEVRAPRTAYLWISTEEAPGILGDIDPDRLARAAARRARASRPWLRRFDRLQTRWAIVGWPTPGWSAQVYPELEPAAAQRALLDDLLSFVRVGPADPPGALEAHLDTLERRAQVLTERAFARLELRGPGTELDVKLDPYGAWCAARQPFESGHRIAANLPTEEVFTVPVAAATEGTFRCTRPLVVVGRIIEGLAGELRGGRLTRLEAARDEDRDVLAGLLKADPGAERLGEVALVDSSSRIGARERIYWETLYDENVASHIAFGRGFDMGRRADAPAASRRTVNRCDVHVDVMIGSPELEVTGIAADGSRTPILRDGLFMI